MHVDRTERTSDPAPDAEQFFARPSRELVIAFSDEPSRPPPPIASAPLPDSTTAVTTSVQSVAASAPDVARDVPARVPVRADPRRRAVLAGGAVVLAMMIVAGVVGRLAQKRAALAAEGAGGSAALATELAPSHATAHDSTPSESATGSPVADLELDAPSTAVEPVAAPAAERGAADGGAVTAPAP